MKEDVCVRVTIFGRLFFVFAFSCLLLSFVFRASLVHLGAALYIRSHVQKGLMICLF